MAASKGSAFEREISKVMSKWWLGNDTEDVCFWRTSQSGGRSTVRHRKGQSTNSNQSSDIGALDERGTPLVKLITFEIKCGYSNTGNIHNLLDKSKDAAVQVYEKWIAQAQEAQGRALTPYWAIIHKRKRRDTLILIPGELWGALRLYCSIEGYMCWQANDLDQLFMMRFDKFLEAVKPDQIRIIYADFLTKFKMPEPTVTVEEYPEKLSHQDCLST